MLLAHPELAGPPEGHILRAVTPSSLVSGKDKRCKTFKGMWQLSKDNLDKLASHKKFGEGFYSHLRKLSPRITNKKCMLVDKTPDYAYKLQSCMNKVDEVPFIVMKKDPRNLYHSLNKRGVPHAKIIYLYRRVYEGQFNICKGKYGERLLLVSWEKFVADPKTIMRTVLKHIGIEFDEKIYTPKFFKKKVRGNTRAYEELPPKIIEKIRAKVESEHFDEEL
jgi:hypothetical protein